MYSKATISAAIWQLFRLASAALGLEMRLYTASLNKFLWDTVSEDEMSPQIESPQDRMTPLF